MASKKHKKEKPKDIEKPSFEDISENFDISKDWDFDLESEEDKRERNRKNKQ